MTRSLRNKHRRFSRPCHDPALCCWIIQRIQALGFITGRRYGGIVCLWLMIVWMMVTTPVLAQQADARFGSMFWEHWGDGKAELAGYALTFPRYGQPRSGTAVAIFVAEPFNNPARVKSNTPHQPGSRDVFPAMKLNLAQDFPTGVYDYNLMTSVFVALEPVNGYPAGAVTKVSFSSQEWCGQVYQQAIFNRDAVQHQLHSYFQGEADQDNKLAAKPDGLSEDALLLWARGLAGPLLEAGDQVTVPILRSMQVARLVHVPLVWDHATLSRSAQTRSVTVPSGTFDVYTYQAAIRRGPQSGAERLEARQPGGGESTWTIDVEAAHPHRVIRWATRAGHKAELLGSARLKYWAMNGQGFEKALSQIGLTPRHANMP